MKHISEHTWLNNQSFQFMSTRTKMSSVDKLVEKTSNLSNLSKDQEKGKEIMLNWTPEEFRKWVESDQVLSTFIHSFPSFHPKVLIPVLENGQLGSLFKNNLEILLGTLDFKWRELGIAQRDQYLLQPNESPSDVCKNFQNHTKDVFYGQNQEINRLMPVRASFLCPEFATFAYNAKTCTPEAESRIFAREFVNTLSKIHHDEDAYRNAANELLGNFLNCKVTRQPIGDFKPNSTNWVRLSGVDVALFFGVVNYKNMQGDPLRKAIAYYQFAMNENSYIRSNLHEHSFCPVLIFQLVGSMIQFGGCIEWNKSAFYVPLTQGHPLITNADDVGLMESLAQTLEAFKIAYKSLKRHYKLILSDLKTKDATKQKATVENWTGKRDFFITKVEKSKTEIVNVVVDLDNHLRPRTEIFRLNNPLTNETEFIRKFSHEKYGKKVHQELAKHGLAPKLYYCKQIWYKRFEKYENIHAPWVETIMDYLDGYYSIGNSKLILSDDAKKKAVQNLTKLQKVLSDAKMVHGDLREPNVMINIDGDIKVVDFDWASFIGKAFFSKTADAEMFRREYEVEIVPGGEITMEHDSALINQLKLAL